MMIYVRINLLYHKYIYIQYTVCICLCTLFIEYAKDKFIFNSIILIFDSVYLHPLVFLIISCFYKLYSCIEEGTQQDVL